MVPWEKQTVVCSSWNQLVRGQKDQGIGQAPCLFPNCFTVTGTLFARPSSLLSFVFFVPFSGVTLWRRVVFMTWTYTPDLSTWIRKEPANRLVARSQEARSVTRRHFSDGYPWMAATLMTLRSCGSGWWWDTRKQKKTQIQVQFHWNLNMKRKKTRILSKMMMRLRVR